MEDEDLDDNPFLLALRMRAPDLYKRAADEALLICCPKTVDQRLSLNRTCFETHILRASPFFAGVYECLNSDKTVELEGSVLETQRGFLEHRKVRVLHEDLHYNSDFKPFRVLCISQALEGGSRVVEERRRPARAAREPEARDLDECRTLFLALNVQDIAPLTVKASSAVRDFFLTYRIFAKGYLHVVAEKLNALLDRAAEQLVAANARTLDEYQRGSKRWGHLRRVVSTVLLQDTRISAASVSALGDGAGRDAGGMSAHTTLFERVRATYKEEDQLVSAAVAHKQLCSVADLGADKRLVGCDLSEAVGKMRSLYSLPCTLDKVTVLREVMLAINQGVERAIAAGTVPATVMVGSDDLLPLVIYVLIQSCADKPAAPTAPAGAAGSAGGWSAGREEQGGREAVERAAYSIERERGGHANNSERGVYSNAQLLQHFAPDASEAQSAQTLFDVATFQAAADYLLGEAALLPRRSGLTRSGSQILGSGMLAASGKAHSGAAGLAASKRQERAADGSHDGSHDGSDLDVHLPGLPAHGRAREEAFGAAAGGWGRSRGDTAGRDSNLDKAESGNSLRRQTAAAGTQAAAAAGTGAATAAPVAPEPAHAALASTNGGVGRVGRGLERMRLDAERQTAPVILATDTAGSGEDLGDFLRQLRAQDAPCSSGRGFPF